MTSTIEWNRKRDESVVQVASPVFVKFHGPVLMVRSHEGETSARWITGK